MWESMIFGQFYLSNDMAYRYVPPLCRVFADAATAGIAGVGMVCMPRPAVEHLHCCVTVVTGVCAAVD